MDYRKAYIKIISKAKSENRKKRTGVYYEAHHILPKSLFPLWKKRKSNIVLLTAREHFFCHRLLVKIYPCKEMWCCLMFFCNMNKYQSKKTIISSREYETIKNNVSRSLKEAWTPEKREKERNKWTPEKRIEAGIRQMEKINNDEEYLTKVRRRVINNIVNECRRKFDRKIKNRIVCLETGKVYDTIKEAASDTGCYYVGITRVLKGNSKFKSIKGLHFYYELNKMFSKEIICIETNTKYKNPQQAIKELNLHSGLYKHLQGKQTNINGLHFKYAA